MSEDKKKGVYKNFISGGISASIARTFTNPIERVEIFRQLQNTEFKGLNLGQSIVKMYNTQGVVGIFKGNMASIIRVFPFSALEFYFIEFYKNLIIRRNSNRVNSVFFNFICGGLTGLTAATLTFPLDVARTRLAATTLNSELKENRIVISLMHLWKTEGLKGLYKGYSIACFGNIFFTAIKQTTFDFFRRKYIAKSTSKYKTVLNLYYGSLAGIIGTFFMYPAYMIKRVLQANNNKDFRLFSYLLELHTQHGIRGFYLGFSMTLLKTAPYIGITFWCNEKLKEILKY